MAGHYRRGLGLRRRAGFSSANFVEFALPSNQDSTKLPRVGPAKQPGRPDDRTTSQPAKRVWRTVASNSPDGIQIHPSSTANPSWEWNACTRVGRYSPSLMLHPPAAS